MYKAVKCQVFRGETTYDNLYPKRYKPYHVDKLIRPEEGKVQAYIRVLAIVTRDNSPSIRFAARFAVRIFRCKIHFGQARDL